MSDHDDKTNNQNEKPRKTFGTIKASRLPPDWASRNDPVGMWPDSMRLRIERR